MTPEEILRSILEENARRVGEFQPQHVGGLGGFQPPPQPDYGGQDSGLAALLGAPPPTETTSQRPGKLPFLLRAGLGLQPVFAGLSHNAGTARGQLFLRSLVNGWRNRAAQDASARAAMGQAVPGGDGRSAYGGGRSSNPLADELTRARIEEIRARMNKPDLAAERGIDDSVARNERAQAITDARLTDYAAGTDAKKALAERRRRPDAARSASGSRKGGGGKGSATYAGERAQLKARRDAEMSRHAGIAAQMEKGEGAAYLGRKRAEVNDQYQQLLADLDARYGVTHNTAESASGSIAPKADPLGIR